MNGGVIHIAGVPITVDPFLHQRCGWCGAVLEDYDLRRVAVPEGQNPTPATWGVGDLVAVEGIASWVVDHIDGADLPDDACAQLDPSVTL